MWTLDGGWAVRFEPTCFERDVAPGAWMIVKEQGRRSSQRPYAVLGCSATFESLPPTWPETITVLANGVVLAHDVAVSL
jgi:hypothetical protein